jgi:hypothetical protein
MAGSLECRKEPFWSKTGGGEHFDELNDYYIFKDSVPGVN